MAADDSQRGRNRVAADAAARGIDVEFVERTAARSLEEAAQILGIAPGDIVKSLVVKRHDGTFLFAEVPGDRQISWAKLRENASRRTARPRSQHSLTHEACAVTGDFE